jgi:DNA repair exonuclease SbcCD nuclease subunit
MIDAVLFADIHMHPFFSCSHMKGGVNSRLRICRQVLRQVKDYVYREKVPHTFFLGDIYQSVSHPDVVEVVNCLYEDLQNWPGELYALVGNHDWVSESRKVHGLEVFKSFIHVVDQPELFELQGERVFMVPFFRAGVRKILSQVSADLFLIHQGVDGVPVRGQLYLKEPDKAEDLEEVGRIYSGHYHFYNRATPNLTYVGSLLSRDWADVGDTKGFIHLKEGNRLRIATQAPNFVEITLNSESDLLENKYLIQGNYVRMNLNFICSAADTIAEAYALGALWAGAGARKSKRSERRSRPPVGDTVALQQIIYNRVVEAPEYLAKRPLYDLGVQLLDGRLE